MIYSVDFRRHVLFVRGHGCLTIRETSERFPAGVAFIVRWLKEPEPEAFREGRPRKIDLDILAQDLRDHPDAYQYERAARFGVTQKANWMALRKLDTTRKKKCLIHPKADETRRQAFQARLAGHEADGKAVVYLDD